MVRQRLCSCAFADGVHVFGFCLFNERKRNRSVASAGDLSRRPLHRNAWSEGAAPLRSAVAVD
jgi:hypothetical protein